MLKLNKLCRIWDLENKRVFIFDESQCSHFRAQDFLYSMALIIESNESYDTNSMSSDTVSFEYVQCVHIFKLVIFLVW